MYKYKRAMQLEGLGVTRATKAGDKNGMQISRRKLLWFKDVFLVVIDSYCNHLIITSLNTIWNAKDNIHNYNLDDQDNINWKNFRDEDDGTNNYFNDKRDIEDITS